MSIHWKHIVDRRTNVQWCNRCHLRHFITPTAATLLDLVKYRKLLFLLKFYVSREEATKEKCVTDKNSIIVLRGMWKHLKQFRR
jgi:hypothetical protein